MSTVVSLNTRGKGTAADVSMYLDAKKRAVLTKGQPVKEGVAISDRPMTRGFSDVVMARLFTRGATKNFPKHL